MELQDLIKELQSHAQQERLKKVAEKVEGKTILDVGAGPAMIIAHMPEIHRKGYKPVDAEPKFVEYLQEQGFKAEVANINTLPFEDQSYDTVIASEVLEHIENPGVGLGELMRVAKDQVIITIPENHTWEEHAWLFSWQLHGGWLILNMKRNPNFNKKFQEFK